MTYDAILTLLILAICATTWGEYWRFFSLKKLFPNNEMRAKMVNCNRYLRMLNILLILSALGLQCMIVYQYNCLEISPDPRLSVVVFALLVLEQLIPTRRTYRNDGC